MQTARTSRATINPFRPGSGLFPPCLAGRALDIELFSAKLHSTINGTPKNILVFGDRKMGKTSFLLRAERIAVEKKLLLVSIIASPTSLKDFLMTLVIRLWVEVKSHAADAIDAETLLRLFQERDFNSFHEMEMAFTDLLIKVSEATKNIFPAIVFSADDLDLLEAPEQALTFLQNVTKNIFRRNCPIIFLLSASNHFYESIFRRSPEASHYFEPILIGKLPATSLVNAIQIPLEELEISYDENILKEIARRSDGFPFYLQAIAHHVFEEMAGELDAVAFRRGYARAIQVLERDVFYPLYQTITSTEAKIYLDVFLKGSVSFSELLNLPIPRGSVASSLKRLREKQLLEQEEKRYQVTDRLFGNYLEKKMKEDKKKELSDGFPG